MPTVGPEISKASFAKAARGVHSSPAIISLVAECNNRPHRKMVAHRNIMVYPNALYVGTAVWMAEQEGVINSLKEPDTAQLLVGYQRALRRMSKLRDLLAAASDGKSNPGIAVVLLGPMLWTRYEVQGQTVGMIAHAAGRSEGDVVIVTDEPVVDALLEGRLTSEAARKRGLMRFYGVAERVQAVTDWLDRLPPPTGLVRTDASK